MFIRDPIERLMSAYRDRKPGIWFRAQKLSFYEYLMTILKTPTRELNRHLRLFSVWCQPCSVTYDFIGRLNNFDEDMETILESVGAKDLAILPKRNETGYKNAKSSDVVDKFKRNIPVEIRKQIYEKYYIDYYLFGFPRPY